MNRRKFISNLGLTGVGTLLSTNLLAQEAQKTQTSYSSKNGTNANKDYYITMSWYLDAIYRPNNVQGAEKILTIDIYSIKPEDSNEQRMFGCKYTIDDVDEKDGNYIVKGYTTKVMKEPLRTLPFDLKQVHLLINKKDGTVEWLDKKSKSLATMKSSTGYDDCFLTTACVSTFNKPDDCFELTTLRQFRDNVLLKKEEGVQLVKEYYSIAPTIVNNINSTANAKLIYKDIYNKMITPTIQAIASDDNDLAISIYRSYTLKLNRQFGVKK